MPEGMDPHFEEQIREIARDEVASLCGLVLRRAQEVQLTRSPDRNMAAEVFQQEMSEIFGEALQQFTAAGPGQEQVEENAQ